VALTSLSIRFPARQGTARHGTARHGTARQGKARQGKARQGKARHGIFYRLLALTITFTIV